MASYSAVRARMALGGSWITLTHKPYSHMAVLVWLRNPGHVSANARGAGLCTLAR